MRRAAFDCIGVMGRSGGFERSNRILRYRSIKPDHQSHMQQRWIVTVMGEPLVSKLEWKDYKRGKTTKANISPRPRRKVWRKEMLWPRGERVTIKLNYREQSEGGGIRKKSDGERGRDHEPPPSPYQKSTSAKPIINVSRDNKKFVSGRPARWEEARLSAARYSTCQHHNYTTLG